MTVAENFVLGDEPRAGISLDQRTAAARVRELGERYGLRVDPEAKVADITLGQQQRIEILRALDRGARVLVLDEPTSVLSAQEVGTLFEVLRRLRDQGTSIVFISHKLREVRALADRVSVLRAGRNVGTVATRDVDEAQLAELMVGREVLLRVEKAPAQSGKPRLEVRDLVVEDDRGLRAVDGISLDVCAGEIVAIAGVDGNGQSELIEGIVGLRAPSAGSVAIAGEEVTGLGPRALSEHGLSHIAEDRHRRGLVLDFNLGDNVALRDFRQGARLGLMARGRQRARAERLLTEYDVRGGGPGTQARALSGGNQQKVVIAREMSVEPRVLVAAQPTRGLDVGAIEFVHRRLIAARDSGCAVLLVSLELEEVQALADRILVVFAGEIVGELSPNASDAELGLLMSGSKLAA
jgi:simple sugar transport system ATP-binding protein